MTSDRPQFLAVTLDKNTNLQREWERERERERESGFYSHKGAGGQMNIRPSKLATIFRAHFYIFFGKVIWILPRNLTAQSQNLCPYISKVSWRYLQPFSRNDANQQTNEETNKLGEVESTVLVLPITNTKHVSTMECYQ